VAGGGHWGLVRIGRMSGVSRAGRFLAAAVAAALVAGLGACGGGDDETASDDEIEAASDDLEPGDETTTTGDDEPSTAGPATPEEQAIVAYNQAFEAFFAALNPPDPRSPALAQTFGGDALVEVTSAVRQAQSEAVYVVGSMETHPRVESASSTEVVLVDCAVETNTTYDAATAQVKDEGSYASHRRSTVVNHDGRWTVDEFEQLEEPCDPGES
jgi:hypothetical protein